MRYGPLLALLLVAPPAFAASYTVTTTAAQDDVLTQAAQAAGKTNAQFVADLVADGLKGERRKLLGARLCVSVDETKWTAATAGQRTAICALCGTAPQDCPQ